MYTLHYIIPLIVYYYKRDKEMLLGLLLANLIDLDHIYERIVGKVPWFGSACPGGFGTNCSIGTYPLHSLPIFLVALVGSILMLYYKKINIWFWILIGIVLHFVLDYIHYAIGFGI